jgi:hemerythrin
VQAQDGAAEEPMVAWDPALETGLVEIDDQHRLIFKKAGATLDAVAAGGGAGEVQRALRFLVDYAALHFRTEERYMALSNYPHAALHSEDHERLTHRLVELSAAYQADGATGALVGDLVALISGWLTDHILGADRLLAAHLRATQP